MSFLFVDWSHHEKMQLRDRSRTTATSKMELFVIIVNGFQPLSIITTFSILDVAAVLDPLLQLENYCLANPSLNKRNKQRNNETINAEQIDSF